MDLFRTSEFRVGLLVTVVLVLVAVMIVQVSEDPSLHGRTQQTYFKVSDASGLVKNSSVKMAGIAVGLIREIRLEDGVARVEIAVRRDVGLTKNAKATIKANGILGDRYVEISPGEPGGEPLNDGEPITKVVLMGGMDDVMNQVAQVTKSLEDVAASLKDATTGEGSQTTPLGRIVHNIEVLTADLSEFTQGNKKKLNGIIDNLHSTTETIDDLVNDESDEGFRKAWQAAVKSLKKIDRSLTNIEEITGKVNSGQGTLGRLINDDETINEINTAVNGVNQMLGTANKIQTNLDFHSEYLATNNLYKTYLGVRIQPGLDRYYEIQVVDDPKGVTEITRTETSRDPGGDQPTVTERKTFKNRVKFTALFAKNFYDFTVKGGLIENSGGVGVDYHLLRRKVRLSTELFDVKEKSVRLRSSVRYNFARGVYVIGGADDYATKDVTSYIGAGLDLTNDDLKALLGKVSF